ncbi:hypothetical protein FB567DRAFT_592559 [Paraphoma chrysanthemicola]|uniref:Uncharacterized protein n=1 Tax=Paraphoma chrysanthemicola TaxID=798071 RepID=A0A8K0R4Z0_9PLEO|nr:hypothetical protein FB567DRAFT_592559 [Paraphoma chrysanthemicola]
MSQPSRPSSSQASHGPQRMPIEAAEALLWGKATRDEQKRLYSRVHELMKQHQNYETRIQSTEVIAEAAEAATARIRSIEKKVEAIESDEHDRPFDKWAEAEIETFKIFVEKNKNVRQKQLELERQVSSVTDEIDKISRDASHEVEILQARIGRLETDRMNDANTIRKLERDVANLMTMRQTQYAELDVQRAKAIPENAPRQMIPSPSRQQDVHRSVKTSKITSINIPPPGLINRHTPMKMVQPQPKVVPRTTSYEDQRLPMGAGRSGPNHMVPPQTGYQVSNIPAVTSLGIEPRMPHAEARWQAPGRTMPPPSRQPHVEDSDTEDEFFGTPSDSTHAYREQPHVDRRTDGTHMTTSSKLLPSSKTVDMSARFRMMQRPSIHDPKRSREFGRQSEAFQGLSQNCPSGDQLPPTQIVNRVDMAEPIRAPSPVEHPQQNEQPEAPAQLIVILSPGKRKLEVLTAGPQQQKPNNPAPTPRPKKLKLPAATTPRHRKSKQSAPIPGKTPCKETVQTPRRKKLPDRGPIPRETRSQAKQKRGTTRAHAQDPTAEKNDPVINDLDVEEPVTKKRKLDNPPMPPPTHPRQQNGANELLRTGSNEGLPIQSAPRKTVQFVEATHSRQGLTNVRTNAAVSAKPSTKKATQLATTTPRRSNRLNRHSPQISNSMGELPELHTPARSAFQQPTRPWKTPKVKAPATASTPDDEFRSRSPEVQSKAKAVRLENPRSPVKSGKSRQSRHSPVKGARSGNTGVKRAQVSNAAVR